MESKYQLWGTFSVKDHVKAGAFIAEVLMYDRLVIPIPPQRDADDKEKTKEAEEEWERWKIEKWDPGRQRQLLTILGDLAVPVEWTKKRQLQWANLYERSHQNAADHIAKELAFQVTGETLLDVVPAMAAGAVAVAPYTSLDELKADFGLTERSLTGEDLDSAHQLSGNALSAILGREFLVPEDPDKDDFELLAEAVTVVRKTDYREFRAGLYAWQEQFLNSERTTDVASITEAVKEMNKHLENLQRITRQRTLWKGLRHCFFFGQLATTSAASLMNPVAVEVGKAAISLGKFTTSQMLANPANPYDKLPAGALLLDAQRKLGLTLTGERR